MARSILACRSKLSDFVEKNGSAFGHGQQSLFGLVGAGESALHVTEEFAFDQRGDQRPAVYRDERLVAEGTGVVNGSCNHLLAGAAFPEDQHRVNAVGGLGDDAIELFHFGGATDDAAESLFGLHFLAQQAVFRLQLQVAGNTLQQHLKFVGAERFCHIVVRAIFHGLHRGLHSAVAGDDDDYGFRTSFLDAAKRIETAGAGQAQVEKDGVEGLGVEKAVGMLGGIGYEC
jgi:hypothetical protein